MTLTTMTARSGGAATRDRSVVVVLLLMLALVFGPAIGLHVAVNLLGPGAAPDGLAATATEAPRGARG
ncbi:hypothetical protein NS228_25620 [Methylobacterium indicum]|uniref:Uncharacterized protein n=2 Tax=Methylobacterium indicum TaxID=1775910 RepID=A0ABR5GZ39_9HYPH|nr:hypothetical protein [Methylobacterium indicum]KMO15656.1 hypothetical protein QR79_24045 [Methylobacterium indicum]KMO18233.1 hypothetical protein QR78_15680 [Methylobacterium indicum]KTS14873.1 hypothetical protein NS229_27860 [Methylobacterium indicum]KTS26167.1 hypothetical protein NS228_25620 [Methylobacterium indicum]KTS48325.1 hypothetical protein NS230_19250 [Methylobacterium indicum]